MNFEGMGELDWGKTGMEFEVDEQGQHHAFNHADDVMDTDLVQEGVWQRVRVKTLYPILKKYEYWNNILLKELRGEVRTIQYYIFRESHFILNPPPPPSPPLHTALRTSAVRLPARSPAHPAHGPVVLRP